ncbi:MAG: hypothetical protein M1495_21210 [Bacteroidetes bacterium]|nr:hypothetical protein [Bacteroidota bacterium]
MQKLQKILSFLFLISFGLFFAHSELNFLSEVAQGYPHNHHDYCKIVKEARIIKTDNFQKKIISQDILFNYDDCCTECKEINDILQNAQFTSTKKFFSVNTFLLNKTLLI